MSEVSEPQSEYDEKTADAMFLAAVNPTVPHVSSIKDVIDVEPVVTTKSNKDQPKAKEKNAVTQKKNMTDPVTTMTTAEMQLRAVQQRVAQRKLYMINGRVRLEQNTGVDVIRQEADQMRLVWALNDDEAVEKYTRYFADLSNAGERYVVLGVSITESID